MTAAVYARLRVADPGRWRTVAAAWRRWATLAGRLAGALTADIARLGAAWSGAAATAAAARVTVLRRGLVLFQVLCSQADQAASEFAESLDRARRLLARALAAARRAGLTIDDDGAVRGGPAPTVTPDLEAAIAIAASADDAAATRLEAVSLLRTTGPGATGPAGSDGSDATDSGRPDCTASPAEVRRWWAGLTPAQRQWLLATEAGWLAPLDGIPAADRDVANRLLLDERRAEVDRALAAGPGPARRRRLLGLRHGLDALADRLADDAGPRAYLLRLDPRDEGRVVVALGDPDRAANVVTHVPGMTAGLASFGGELSRVSRVASRAGELAPTTATSGVLWLDYDAPDFVDEAASPRRAEAGAPALRRFQDGLRATHVLPAARQTVVGHSYGSLLVGRAAATPGLPVDDVVFVGSPGVGVAAARDLAVPPGHVWATTSRSDIIQYATPAPGAFLRDVATSVALPPAAVAAFGTPERDLWFGRNPADPAFGAHTFPSATGAGHLGYWQSGSSSLDELAAITLGTAR
ncbi:alpha/beta hydrolase [Actinoplanes sp. CA-030573]|uniref:alpha/beta hydrolase n=1 Tax=Actinoplanes sp. CA-030573 TaxID=3239898 RepID=UPI003D91350D